MIHYPLSKLCCSSLSDGAACAIICSEKFLSSRPDLQKNAIEIKGMALVTDTPSTFKSNHLDLVGSDMTSRCVQKALKEANFEISDVDAVELHDSNAV